MSVPGLGIGLGIGLGMGMGMGVDALVLNSGSPTALQVLRCLDSGGVGCALADQRPPDDLLAARSRLHRSFYRYSGWEDFLRIGEEVPGAVLISCDDRSIYSLSEHFQELSKYFRIPFPDHSVLVRGQDKAEAWRACLEAGVPTPRTYQPSPGEVRDLSRSLEYPVLVKPRLTLGFIPQHARKLYVCRTAGELESSYDAVNRTHPDPLIQERIPGGDDSVYQIMVLMDREQGLVGSFCFRKLAQWPLRYGVGCLCVSVHLPVLLEQTLSFLREIGWFGVASIEYKHDPRDDLFKLIDVNTRFCGETNLAMAAGLNFPLALYHLAWGEQVSLGEYPDGVYWTDFYKTLRNLRFRFKSGSYSGMPRTFLRAIDPRTTHTSLSIRDPGPAAMRAEKMLSRVLAAFTGS